MFFLCSWSGAKDSCYPYYLAVKEGLEPSVLLTVLNEHKDHSRSHRIPKNYTYSSSISLGSTYSFF